MSYDLDWLVDKSKEAPEVQINATKLGQALTDPFQFRYLGKQDSKHSFGISIDLIADYPSREKTVLVYDQENKSYFLRYPSPEKPPLIFSAQSSSVTLFEASMKLLFNFSLPTYRYPTDPPLRVPSSALPNEEDRASVPEPPPQKRGVEVTPLLLVWLKDKGCSQSICDLVEARRQYGLKKYGQSLYSEDQRDTLEDARQEAGDLLQYLFKATLQSGINKEGLRGIRAVLQACEMIISELDQ